MITPDDLAYAAGRLASAYAELADLKWTPTRPTGIKVRRSQDGSRSPSPDNDTAFNLEYELQRETPNEHIPGGLRAMARDALSYTTARPHAPQSRGYLDEHVTPGVLCTHIARHATEIIEHFPASEELAELLDGQRRFLARRLHDQRGKPSPPCRSMPSPLGSAPPLTSRP